MTKILNIYSFTGLEKEKFTHKIKVRATLCQIAFQWVEDLTGSKIRA